MTPEQHSNDVELQQRNPQFVVSIRSIVRIDQLGEVMDERMQALREFMQQRGIQPAGPPFVRYHTFGETETDLETGVPVAEPVAGEGRIVGSELPGGPVITTWHFGSHDTLGNAYARMHAWLHEHGRTVPGAAWEVYYWIDPSQYGGPAAWPAATTWGTQLIQPISES